VKTFWPEDAGGNFHKIDDYFARVRRQDSQKAQANLGHWAR
jgi:hypothetical protein